MGSENRANPQPLGRGRSAIVYLDVDRAAAVARKVFVGESWSNLVQIVATGAPNPYGWNEHAIRAAACRRSILESLVRFWFGDKLRLPATFGWAWNASHCAFELSAEFIPGRHLPLRMTTRQDADDAFGELTGSVMKPLQRHLIEAGFDGLVWQAGLGNPAAGGNFMLEESPPAPHRWVWVDLESGVPALFPLNPLALFRFYLPRSWYYRRCLFDDVDVAKLEQYLGERRAAIERELGPETMSDLLLRVANLARHQTSWKSVSRTERSIAYCLARHRITREQAEWYSTRPIRWYARLAAHTAAKGAIRVVAMLQTSWRWLRTTDWRGLAVSGWRFAVSQRYREYATKRFVHRRVRSWLGRQFMDSRTAGRLRAELRRGDASQFLADFGAHLAIKPLVKLLQWGLIPLLFAIGAISQPALVLTLALIGPVSRTAYTGIRLLQAVAQGRSRPWTALFVGLLPIVGNAAYPAQIWQAGSNGAQLLPQFLICDTFAGIGRAMPIWGGRDSLLEAWFNRLPHWFASMFRSLRTRRPGWWLLKTSRRAS